MSGLQQGVTDQETLIGYLKLPTLLTGIFLILF